MIAKALIALAIVQMGARAADRDRWVWSRKDDKLDNSFERIQVPVLGNNRGPNRFKDDELNRYDVREPTTERPMNLNKPQKDELDAFNDDPRYGGAGFDGPNNFAYPGGGFIPHGPSGNPQKGILVGPEGPTGIIGRPKGNPANGILVGPGGPTGIIGRPYPAGGNSFGGQYPVGPGGPGGQFPIGPGGAGQYPGGPGQFPGGQGQFPGGPGQYPGGPGQYPGGPGQFPGGPGQFPGGPGQFPGGPGQFPGGPGQFAGGSGQFPGGPGQFPGGPGGYPGQFPGEAGQFPGGPGGPYPGGPGQFPGGPGQYPLGYPGYDQGQGPYPGDGFTPYNNNPYDEIDNGLGRKANRDKTKNERKNVSILKSA